MKSRTWKGILFHLTPGGALIRLIAVLAILNIHPCLGIAQKLDSLKALLNRQVGVGRIDVLYGLAFEYIDIDDSLGLYYSAASYKSAVALGDSLRMVKAGRLQALALRRLGKIDSSMALSKQILPIAKRNNYATEVHYLLNGLGMGYMLKAEYDKSLDYQFQLLKFNENHEGNFDITATLNNLGLTYYKLKDYDQALVFYGKSLRLKKEIHSDFDLGALLLNISLCHTYKGDFTLAQYYLDTLTSTCNGQCNESIIAKMDFNLGIIAFMSHDYSTAQSWFLASYGLAKKLVNDRLVLDNIVYLAQVYIKNGSLDLAEAYLTEAEDLINQGLPYSLELIKVYNALYTLYGNSGDFRKVAFYQEKYILLKDSIYNEELTRNLMKVEVAYQERENNAKIQSQNEILALDSAVIFRQRILNAFVGIIVVLLIILTRVLVKNNRKRKVANIMLERMVKERTVELEINRDRLERTLVERNIAFTKISSDIKSSIATIKGLSALGLSDSKAEHICQYMHKIDNTAENLLRMLKSTLSLIGLAGEVAQQK